MQRILTVAALSFLVACSQPPAEADGLPEPIEALGMQHVSAPADDLICAGQPSEAQFDALRAAGVTRMLHLRQPGENGTGWEEERAAAAGIDFTRLEIAGRDGLTRDNVEAFAKWLEQPHEGLTMVSCGSSNRVGAMFALKAYWLDGKPPQEALELGRRAGMTRLAGAVEQLMANPR